MFLNLFEYLISYFKEEKVHQKKKHETHTLLLMISKMKLNFLPLQIISIISIHGSSYIYSLAFFYFLLI